MTRQLRLHAGATGASAYVRPSRMEDALAALAAGQWAVLAGGTDFFAMQGEAASSLPVLDITALDELRGIDAGEEEWRIGALTSWTQIIEADLPPAFDGLKLAGREVGSVQIQNRATIAGNLCNASPAADGVPPLLCLDALIELRSTHAVRRLPLADFLRGYRTTARQADELVTAIIVPRSAGRGSSGFLKLGARKYLVISIAMAALRLVLDASGRIGTARIAIGACSVTAQRLAGLEHALVGHDPRLGYAELVAEADLSSLLPIDDVRAPADYRLTAARELILRLLEGTVP